MSQRTHNSGLHQAQGVWQDMTTTNPNYITDPSFINPTFDPGPLPAHNQHHQSPNMIHHSPQPRGSKSHRYMTRQTHTQSTSIVPTNSGDIINKNNGLSRNVIFRDLPFYDKVCELIRPTGLRSDGVVGRPNESHIEFRLTIDQADLIAMSQETVNIILRFCTFDTSSEQNDNFPPEITIKVNENTVQLPTAISNPNRPNVPPKRPGQHVDITRLCKLSPFVNNFVKVAWFVDPTDISKSYATTIMIGERVGLDTLLQRVVDRGTSAPEETKKLIVDSDSEVATTNLQCSLLCPLGKMKMTNPCKSVKCNHIPCFDASVYLQMNEKKATWSCPVCFQPAYFPELQLDGFFMDILQKTPPTVTDVTLNLDGSWNPVMKMEQQPASTKKPAPELIIISDDDDE